MLQSQCWRYKKLLLVTGIEHPFRQSSSQHPKRYTVWQNLANFKNIIMLLMCLSDAWSFTLKHYINPDRSAQLEHRHIWTQPDRPAQPEHRYIWTQPDRSTQLEHRYIWTQPDRSAQTEHRYIWTQPDRSAQPEHSYIWTQADSSAQLDTSGYNLTAQPLSFRQERPLWTQQTKK